MGKRRRLGGRRGRLGNASKCLRSYSGWFRSRSLNEINKFGADISPMAPESSSQTKRKERLPNTFTFIFSLLLFCTFMKSCWYGELLTSVAVEGNLTEKVGLLLLSLLSLGLLGGFLAIVWPKSSHTNSIKRIEVTNNNGRKPRLKPVKAAQKEDSKDGAAKARMELSQRQRKILHQYSAGPYKERRYPSRSRPSGRGCRNCGELDHWVRECPHQYRPDAQQYTSSASASPYQERGYSSRTGSSGRGCRNCGDLAHWVRECPLPRRGVNQHINQPIPQLHSQ